MKIETFSNLSKTFQNLTPDQKKNIALIVAGTLLLLGAILLVTLTATGKLGSFTTTKEIAVRDHFEITSGDLNGYSDYTYIYIPEGIVEKTVNLAAVNYTLYGVMALGGCGLLGWGVKRELNSH